MSKYKLNMQRCPYIHEMKERLLGDQIIDNPKIMPAENSYKMESTPFVQQPVATVVRINANDYASHTSPTHHLADQAPLMPKESQTEFCFVDRSHLPKNAKTSLFIVMSFVYAKLLVVICLAYVVSDVVTHNIPLYYYEGFFTYLYGMSILFLLYVFCFLLQESTCCSSEEKVEKVEKDKKGSKDKQKEKEKEKKKEEEKKKKEDKEKDKKEKKEKGKDKEKDKKNKKQEKGTTYRRNSEGVVDSGLPEPSAQNDVPVVPQEQPGAQPPAPPPQPQQQLPQVQISQNVAPTSVDLEAGVVSKCKRKRKTTQNDQSHGSFFLRIAAIAFGLATMIYNGLEFGTFFEVPFTSPCYMILRGINPCLQMIFTFMQMYFIFMNSRLNIHRFKVIARFGLMHIVATNICVWVRTLVIEYIKEVTIYHQKLFNDTRINDTTAIISGSIRQHSLRNSDSVLGYHVPKPDATVAALTTTTFGNPTVKNFLWDAARTTTTTLKSFPVTFPTVTTKRVIRQTTRVVPTTFYRMYQTFTPSTTTTTTTTTTTPSTTTFLTTTKAWKPFITTSSSPAPNIFHNFMDSQQFNNFVNDDTDNSFNLTSLTQGLSESFNSLLPQALVSTNTSLNATNTSCGRVNIMGTIVQDSAPFLFPFIIEYSLIGAAVIYVMWKHIGRNPKYVSDEDLEHRLEVMLSRRAVALAHAQRNGRVDCVGASKGLFFGLLLLVGSLICLILFFVLIHQEKFSIVAIYLADVSHCVVMGLSIIAILIGFIRVQHLKFRIEEQTDLNDILLRVSAFGLFLYAVFSVIAGHFNAFTKEPNMLVMITGIMSVVQVVLQLLFISDVSRRRVYLPEHDRSKPGRQIVTFLLICNITMWIIYTFEIQKVEANPVQLEFYGFLAWAVVQRFTLPLCIFHRFHSAVTLAEIWKSSYKMRLE